MSPYRQTPDRPRGRMLERIVLRATPHFVLIAPRPGLRARPDARTGTAGGDDASSVHTHDNKLDASVEVSAMESHI